MRSVLRARKQGWLLVFVAISMVAVGCGDSGSDESKLSSLSSPDPLASPPAEPAGEVTTGPTSPASTSSASSSRPRPAAASKPGPQGAASAPQSAPVAEGRAPATKAGIVLQGTGLGIVSFGEPETEVVERLTAELGRPTRDEVKPPYCRPNEEHREVHWDTLRVGFTDGKFARYFYRQSFNEDFPPVATAKGIGPGSTLDEIKKAYGEDLPPGPESLGQSYSLQTESGPVGAFFGDVVPAPGTEKGLHALAAGGFCDS